MSAPPIDFEGLQKPWIEDLIKYGIRYNIEPTDLRKGIEIMRKAVSNGDLWTALNVLTVLIGNGQSPPHYLFPIPADSIPMVIYILNGEALKAAGCHIRGNAETYGVVIGYCYRVNGKSDLCEMIGWKLHWLAGIKLFFTEPMPLHELGLISKYVEVKHGGEPVGNAGGVHLKEEGNDKGEESGEYEPVPEVFQGPDLDQE